MPYINLQILEGASRDQKKQLVNDFTSSLVRVLDKKPEHIHMVIDEISTDNWGFAGKLTSDYGKPDSD